jgi:hypothetical protein
VSTEFFRIVCLIKLKDCALTGYRSLNLSRWEARQVLYYTGDCQSLAGVRDTCETAVLGYANLAQGASLCTSKGTLGLVVSDKSGAGLQGAI